MTIVRMLVASAIALGAASFSVWAQAPQAPPQPPKDRKDFIIDALEQQRNNSTSGLAVCEATFNDVTTQLRKQIETLTAENATLKKPAAAPDAAPQPK